MRVEASRTLTFSEQLFQVGKLFCWTYGMVWLVFPIAPARAATFSCLAYAISEYGKHFFSVHFKPPFNNIAGYVTGFIGAKILGSLVGFHLTLYQASSVLVINALSFHLYMLNRSP